MAFCFVFAKSFDVVKKYKLFDYFKQKTDIIDKIANFVSLFILPGNKVRLQVLAHTGVPIRNLLNYCKSLDHIRLNQVHLTNSGKSNYHMIMFTTIHEVTLMYPQGMKNYLLSHLPKGK